MDFCRRPPSRVDPFRPMTSSGPRSRTTKRLPPSGRPSQASRCISVHLHPSDHRSSRNTQICRSRRGLLAAKGAAPERPTGQGLARAVRVRRCGVPPAGIHPVAATSRTRSRSLFLRGEDLKDTEALHLTARGNAPAAVASSERYGRRVSCSIRLASSGLGARPSFGPTRRAESCLRICSFNRWSLGVGSPHVVGPAHSAVRCRMSQEPFASSQPCKWREQDPGPLWTRVPGQHRSTSQRRRRDHFRHRKPCRDGMCSDSRLCSRSRTWRYRVRNLKASFATRS